MGKFKGKRTKKRNKEGNCPIITKTRKDIRKEKRNLKKINKQNYFSKSDKKNGSNEEIGKYVRLPKPENQQNDENISDATTSTKKQKNFNKAQSFDARNIIENENKGAKVHEERLKEQMKKQRNSQLLKANKDEDKIIKKLEKQLKIKKKKSGSISKSFASDGLGYLLEVCDEKTMAAAIAAEKHLAETGSGSDFEEDVAIATGQNRALLKNTKTKSTLKNTTKVYLSDNDNNSDSEISDNSNSFHSNEFSNSVKTITRKKPLDHSKNNPSKSGKSNDSDENCSILEEDLSASDDEHSIDDDDEEMMDGEDSDEDFDEEEIDEEELDDSMSEELSLIYSGMSSFPDEAFQPGNLTPVLEETESDLDLYQNNVDVPHESSTLDTSEDIFNCSMDIPLCEESENSDMDESDESECSNASCLNSDDDMNNKQIVVNGKPINTYGRDVVNDVEPEVIRCPILDKFLDNLSNSESEPDHIIITKDAVNNSVAMKVNADNSNDQQRKKRKLDKSSLEENLKKAKIKDNTMKQTEAYIHKAAKSNSNNDLKEKGKNNKSRNIVSDESLGDSDILSEDMDSGSDNETGSQESENDKRVNESWEDIYGRKRDKSGNVIAEQGGKYVPPHLRIKNNIEESKEMIHLKRQIKGLLNKVAGSNMHWTSTQIENLYSSNSRYAVNSAFCSLWIAALVQTTPTSDRMAAEHAMLVAILHANIGSEIGAHFLQTAVKKFDEILLSELKLNTKELDNLVLAISHLYSFKIFQSALLYEILEKLVENLSEKTIECLLVALRSVGGVLRRDDPAALKAFIHNTQDKATNFSDIICDGSRVKFLLDVLMAIKNNNMNKIPNYDPSYSEELKKSMKGIIRKGNYVVPLNIKLDDLLKADERGKWWVVGSAWEGSATAETSSPTPHKATDTKHKQLLELARHQRINTDLRKNIFCIIMSAEDYMDAFEKLQQLGLKNQQEREIVHVLIACNLQEKKYNPYYAVLAQKFCDCDRKFQMFIQYSVWDKLKEINTFSGFQIANLAQFLTHLFIDKGLPISILKVIEFSDLTKPTLRLMRQILLAILLHKNWQTCLEVFQRVAVSPKLHLFRESLRLFINHFLIKNSDKKESLLGEDQMNLLKERASAVERTLQSDSKLQF